MNLQTIGILGGTGGIGKCFADFFSRKFSNKTILVSGRKTKLTNDEIIKKSDLVIFAVPLTQTLEVIEKMIPHARADQVWADFTSVKEAPMKIMEKSSAQVCGLHPMFGVKKNITGGNIVCTPSKTLKPEIYKKIREIFEDFVWRETTPEKHDQMMAICQGGLYFFELIFAQLIQQAKIPISELLQYGTEIFGLRASLVARMLDQNPDLYFGMMHENPKILQTHKNIVNIATQLATMIQQADRKEYTQTFENFRENFGKEFCHQARQKTDQLMQTHFSAILTAHTKKINTQAKVIIFGEPHSHTHEASQYFEGISQETKKDFTPFLDKIFEAVENNNQLKAIIPFENSIHGSVFEVLEGLQNHPNIKITQSIKQPITQNLIGLKLSNIKSIQVILSHSQALEQSRYWLKSNLSKAQLQNTLSTATAAHEIVARQDSTFACIGNKALAESLGLKILAKNISPEANITRFVMIEKTNTEMINFEIMSFAFWFEQDKPGSLEKLLNIFSNEDIDLTKLESRKLYQSQGYQFFINAKMNIEKYKKIREKIQNTTSRYYIFGRFEN